MSKKTAKEFEQNSYLNAGSSAYLDELYDAYLEDPMSVEPAWRDYFKALPNVADLAMPDQSTEAVRERFVQMADAPACASSTLSGADAKQESVDRLIHAYRHVGHHQADLDPLGLAKKGDEPRLKLDYYGLTNADLNTQFATRHVLKTPTATLKELVAHLDNVYCQTVGIEFTHVTHHEEHLWLERYFENTLTQDVISTDRKITILKDLLASNGLEHHLGVKYPGVKRFSIEGVDALIPAMNAITLHARQNDMKEVVLCMAHRGRLATLLNCVGKPSGELFAEFSGKHEYGMTTGDVKYHLGYSADIKTQAGAIHVSMLFNPSHLDYIDPVLLGSVRGRQDRYADTQEKSQYAIGVMIHGDASFSSQGVIAETLTMSQPPAYSVGGVIHIITNNQIGYTTSNPTDARSSRYCTGIAKSIEAPIVHVNGDDAEAVIRCVDFAFAYRQAFKKDVVLDIVGYRRHGHNEADEPRVTQPIEYGIIKSHPNPSAIYAKQLVDAGIINDAQVKQWTTDYRDKLDAGERTLEITPEGIENKHATNWTPYVKAEWDESIDTKISKDKLDHLNERLHDLPEGFTLLKQVSALMESRNKMADGEELMDWGFAETMAYASLVDEGYPVRFSGEDSRRGTFFHRHAALFDQKTGDAHMPLCHISDKQAQFSLYDSILAEVGPLGFEYGYSTARPATLVLWEAQFGDFANSAQVIVDQFISSAWNKWRRMSGLVLLLPHGYESMGPEHSSARLERYLQLCAQENMQVCVPTTPSQIFHLLRRQVIRPYRRPLIVMTPKSLLRHKMATSPVKALTEGRFRAVIKEIDKDDIKPEKVKRIILCSGKVYYDLLQTRRDMKQTDVAIIRVEQLYPFPYDDVKAVFSQYSNADSICWCQEEPRNQGAWYITRHRLVRCMDDDSQLFLSSRPAMAAPAVGYPALNKQQQIDLVSVALDTTKQPHK
jgi:2-oxoglutarate dehydrogenase E1 component